MDLDVTSRRNVYQGDIPGDIYEGRWPRRLSIFAVSGPNGLTLHGIDSVEWPDHDMYWDIVIAPEHVARLRDALRAAEDANQDQLLELVAARLEDQTIPVQNPSGWLKTNGVEHTLTTRFLEN